MTVLEARGLGRQFNGRWLFRGRSFRVEAAARLCVWGPSGSGKTSLLRLLAGLDLPDEGEILSGEQTISSPSRTQAPHERGMGFSFQSPALWPHMTVGENILFGLSPTNKEAAHERLEQMLRLVELTGFDGRYPAALSGGEACRVALARALAPRPAFLLLDEPLASVEDDLRVRLLERLDGELKNQTTTLIYVTHDRDLAAQLGGDKLQLPAGS